ncbi:MAG: hypothetical protein L0206_10650 [Actinobacteria bacterium]|nr:hypothetical protein [Actinomycetota bacterium]
MDATGRPSGPRSTGALGPIAVIAVLALLVVAAFEAVTGDGERPRASSEADPSSDVDGGTLVYLPRPEGARSSLWVLDLLAGWAKAGPTVPATTLDLVDASGVGGGWLGLVWRAPNGAVRASVIEGVAPGSRTSELSRGDLVAWGPSGKSLVIARNGSGSERCPSVRMSLVFVSTGEVGWTFHDPGFCGPVTSLSRSVAATYLTAPSGDRYGVYLTGQVGGPHLLFEGLSLVSGSPVSSFVLQRADDPAVPADPQPEALLGWNGIGGPISLGRGDESLIVQRVLAWSPDGAQVALVGSLGTSSGVFVVETGSGTGQREPVFVDIERHVSDATFDASGALYLVAEGGLFVYRAGAEGGPVTPIGLPVGAPAPGGPIVWIP